MVGPIAIAVECYSGHNFADRPIAFVWGGRRYQIDRVLKRWRSPDGPGFRVITIQDEEFELTYSQAQDSWWLHLPPGRNAPPVVQPDNNRI